MRLKTIPRPVGTTIVRLRRAGIISCLILLTTLSSGRANWTDPDLGFDTTEANDRRIVGTVCSQMSATLADTSDYEWWYGSAPTAAGMMMGYYDRNGYKGVSYDNLVPGGPAEASSFPVTPGSWDYLSQYAIASPEHVNDFYSGGYKASGDDLTSSHRSNCLADFMGTSQDAAGNANGNTRFFFNWDNTPFTESDAQTYLANLDESGMYGIGEYVRHAGYDVGTMYNQFIFGYNGVWDGFTLSQYQTEIDAGRPVLIHVAGHTLVGFGYDKRNPTTIYVHDTFNPGLHSMTWGGTYGGPFSMQIHYGVTVMEIVPEPATFVLLFIGLVAGLMPRGRKGLAPAD